jgi:hypothetical protein
MIIKMPDKKNKKGGGGTPLADAATDMVQQKRSLADAEIDAAIARSSVKEKQKFTRKKQIKYAIFGVVGLLLSYGIYFLFAPYKGTMAFGICKVFLELTVQFPDELKLSTVEELPTSVRIWYTQIDGFGQYRMEQIQCFFKADETYGSILDKVTIRRREVDPLVVQKFNKTLPIIFAYPPDLTMPVPLPDSLEDLQIDMKRIIRPLFPEGSGVGGVGG